MRFSSIVILVGFLGFTACAHKQAAVDKGEAKSAKVEKKVDKKAEKKEADKQAKSKTYTCLVGKDKRTVTLDKESKRCEVSYTKFGDQKQVAWAESTPSICDDAFSNIRSNIEGSGYKCIDGTNIEKLQKSKDKKEEAKKPVQTAAAETK